MPEYIDRNALIEHMKKDPLFGLVERYGVTDVIESFPAADVQLVKHGRWKFIKPPDNWFEMRLSPKSFYVCNICGHIENIETNYCSNCGAKMDGGE